MKLCLAIGLGAGLIGCTAELPNGTSPDPGLGKADARAAAGKQDDVDLCEWFEWYGDGECDEFCPEPDPDCTTGCGPYVLCPPFFCEPGGPCPTSTCVDGECVIDNPDDRCDAGERECQTCGDNYVCAPHGAGCPLVRCRPPVERCGGLAGLTCSDPNQYCDYEDAAICGAADQMGTCLDRPTGCTREFRPVCGCDGATYSNACSANGNGTSVAHEGACEPPPVAECVTGGCSGQLCIPADGPTVFTTCEWRPEYACYRAATCEHQDDGSCGFTDTPSLRACLDGV